MKPRLRRIFKGPKGEVWQCWSGNQITKVGLIGYQDSTPKRAYKGWLKYYREANPA